MRTRMLASALALLAAACGAGAGMDAPHAADDAATSADGSSPTDGAAEPDPAQGARDGALGPDDASMVPSAGFDGGHDGGVAAPSGDGGVPRPPDPGVISWKPCAEGTRECGTMQVPVNYEDATAGTLKLAVMRRLASGERVGALLINPGGPGTSAVDYLGFFVEDSRSPLLARFDLVAFDPRGVGYSTRIDCHETLQQWVGADPSPDDETEWQAIDARAAEFAASCQQGHAELLPHLDTVNVARDMDQVRAALGEAKLHYLGFSYGASIGAHYAELFPERVGALVLDAPVDLDLSARELALQQAEGFELALQRFFDWCLERESHCPWTQGAAPREAFMAIAEGVESQALAAPGSDRDVGPGEFLTAVGATLYAGQRGWSALSQALSQARTGAGDTLMTFVDGYLQREADGSYPNREEANHAVNCLDRTPMTVAEIRAAAPQFASEAPIFGLPALTEQLICAHWAVQGRDLPPPSAPRAPPLVVLGTLFDPATPYAWAQAMAMDLTSAVLLTASGEGHTAYGRGNACIDSAVEAYLFAGQVPEAQLCEPTVAQARVLLLSAPPLAWWRR